MLKKEVVILIAEDDEGHATLIKKNLKRAGLSNQMRHFRDGEGTLNFLLRRGKGLQRDSNVAYLLLLDIRMPKIDGIEVLRKIKEHEELRKIPVIIITTTDDPREVEECHRLGCSNYITKPVDYDLFIKVIKKLGLFLMVVEIPKINGE